jgi:hypothetical protein
MPQRVDGKSGSVVAVDPAPSAHRPLQEVDHTSNTQASAPSARQRLADADA